MAQPQVEPLDTSPRGAMQTEDTLERLEASLEAEERRLSTAIGAAETSSGELHAQWHTLVAAAEAASARRRDDDSAALLRAVRGLAGPGFPAASVRSTWHVARAAAAARRRSACEAVRLALDEFTRSSGALRAHLDTLRGRLDALEARPLPTPAAPAPDEEPSALEAALAEASARQPPPPVNAPEQRRAHPRRQLTTQVEMDSDSNFFGGFSTDISEGGLFVATVGYPPPGTTVDLRFTLPGGYCVETTGRVQWVREVNDATPDVMPGAGVRFVDLPPAAAEAIRTFVARREPLFFTD